MAQRPERPVLCPGNVQAVGSAGDGGVRAGGGAHDQQQGGAPALQDRQGSSCDRGAAVGRGAQGRTLSVPLCR